jgi:hypothetical protein
MNSAPILRTTLHWTCSYSYRLVGYNKHRLQQLNNRKDNLVQCGGIEFEVYSFDQYHKERTSLLLLVVVLIDKMIDVAVFAHIYPVDLGIVLNIVSGVDSAGVAVRTPLNLLVLIL